MIGGATHSRICDYKDIQHRMVSCPRCVRKLEKGINNDKYSECWNWDINGSKYSETLVDSIAAHVKNKKVIVRVVE